MQTTVQETERSEIHTEMHSAPYKVSAQCTERRVTRRILRWWYERLRHAVAHVEVWNQSSPTPLRHAVVLGVDVVAWTLYRSWRCLSLVVLPLLGVKEHDNLLSGLLWSSVYRH
jgi:hypothetical protein